MKRITASILVWALSIASANAQTTPPPMVPIQSDGWIVTLDQPQHAHVVAVESQAIPPIVLENCHSVGLVKADSGGSQQYGSSTYVGDGLWITNAHVVLNDYGRPSSRFSVRTKDGQEYPAKLVRFEQDKSPDLAVLETASLNHIKPIPIATQGIQEGDIVYPNGFDFGDMDKHRVWPSRVVSVYGSGSIESIGSGRRLGSISGNSGGPTFNAAGELISPLNANGGQSPNVTRTGQGTTITVCWRRTRTFLLPFRERIVRALERHMTQCPPGYSRGANPYCPSPQYYPPAQPSFPQQAQPQPSQQDYSQTVPPSFQPQPQPTPTEAIDYEKLAAALIPTMSEDSRFRGAVGPQGPAGEDGQAGEITTDQLSAVTQSIMQVIQSDARFRGPKGDRGSSGANVDVDALAQQILAKVQHPAQRVVLRDGNGEILEDETYQPGEAIVLDFQSIIRAAKSNAE